LVEQNAPLFQQRHLWAPKQYPKAEGKELEPRANAKC
jgi:hypothetical protein